MRRSCSHCTSKLPATSVLASALGISRSFACRNCARHLAVSRGWKAAFAGALLLGFVVCGLAARMEHSHLPYLALPFLVVFASLTVYRYGVVRIASRRPGWLSLFNLGIFETALIALDYAISL